MEIHYRRSFIKEFEKVPLKIQIACRDRIKLFSSDQFHPQLHNHALLGNFLGYRSINVMADWRAIFVKEGEDCTFFYVRTHSQLYH